MIFSRSKSCCRAIGNKIYIIGGCSYETFEFHPSLKHPGLLCIDLDNRSFQNLDSISGGLVPDCRYGSVLLAIDNSTLLMIGGRGATESFADCHLYDIKTNTWTKIELNSVNDGKLSGKTFVSACLHENFVYLHGTKKGIHLKSSLQKISSLQSHV